MKLIPSKKKSITCSLDLPQSMPILTAVHVIASNVNTHRIHVWYIYANIWGTLMVNVTIYSIHGSYGI